MDALADTWRGAVFDPRRFFAALPPDHPLGPAILYYLAIGIAATGIDLFWRSLLRSVAAGGPFTSLLGSAGDGWSQLIGFLLSPVVLIILLFLTAAAVHAVLALLGGARHGIGTTTRVLCFAYSPRIFAIVPILGGAIGSVWMIVIAIIGLREAHGTDGWRTATAVLLPLLALLILSALLAVAAGAVSDLLGTASAARVSE